MTPRAPHPACLPNVEGKKACIVSGLRWQEFGLKKCSRLAVSRRRATVSRSVGNYCCEQMSQKKGFIVSGLRWPDFDRLWFALSCVERYRKPLTMARIKAVDFWCPEVVAGRCGRCGTAPVDPLDASSSLRVEIHQPPMDTDCTRKEFCRGQRPPAILQFWLVRRSQVQSNRW